MPVTPYDQSTFFPGQFKEKYTMYEWGHATTILKHNFSEEFEDIVQVLDNFQLYKSMITKGGGGKSKVASLFDRPLYAKNWIEKKFDIHLTMDGVEHDTPTHKIDCVKGRVALDVEWNNKNAFYDRDLNNFRLLHSLRAISVGIIITRSTALQTVVFNPLGIGHKYGSSTTHIGKLLPKIEGGGAGGCPLLVIGIDPGCYVDDTV